MPVRPLRRLAALALFALLVAGTLAADSGKDLAPPPYQARVEALLAANDVTKAKVGLAAVSLKTGAVLAALGADEPLVLASNTKLFTTAAALHLLHADFRFTTRVYLTAAPDAAGRAAGDLGVVGGGDPNLSGRAHEGKSTAVFERWAAALAAAGVKEIAGDLVCDDTLFDRAAVNPGWPADQLFEWYCAPVSALALNDDCVDVTVAPGAGAGAPAKVTLEPPTGFVTVQNDCRTTADRSQHTIVIERGPVGNRLRIRGQCWEKSAGLTESKPVRDPALFFGTVLKETLERKGIAVRGAVRLAAAPFDAAGREPAATWESDLPATLRVTNQNSQNFYAEQLLKLLGARATHAPGSWPSGLAAIAGFLEGAGLPAGSYTMADGSGMARKNLFSANQVVTLLRWMSVNADAGVWRESLSVAGTSGTLSKRLAEEAYRGRVRGKTGYIAGVCTLSGYAETRSGDTVAFSILVNQFKTELWKVRQFSDQVARLLVDDGSTPDPSARRGRR
ncbi:MAG: D-alanyl-D-alanine carboxypeptidase/D-alanyl-D-alanine-endopeptidase [Planctomycetes bacterium]|nr:D-alanyl-D-alanine carboxypeptidase/D-alanyl-D-alanine-endopeptidase [Planctomycetota bacterium]